MAIGISDLQDRLKPTDASALFGHFDEGKLAGVVGLQREANYKMQHKAFIWGMYVSPAARSKGVGRALLDRAMDFASSRDGVRQVTLCVVVDDVAARSLYETAGFQSYGTEPEALSVEGRYYDEELMFQYVERT
ncbi:acetyltransferase [Salinisphaera sp. C84B14]|uniref:GNAT family N-acetyltransferase n=1 Tax=Salinisphaera sp. C84B14 TaxID=1304155 RepID=UPI003341BE17